MAEELVLTDPIVPPTPPATTTYRVSSFTMDLDTVAQVEPEATPPLPSDATPGIARIRLKDNNGVFSTYRYTGAAAVTMIKQLNTANLTTKSMHKRILEKLAADGLLPGTVVGTPEP